MLSSVGDVDIEPEVWVALVGVGGVILGSLVSGVMTAVLTRNQSKLNAEQVEKAQKREDDRAAALAKDAREAEAKERAAKIVEEFHTALTEVQTFPRGDDSKFVTQYVERWRTSRAILFRRIIGRLPNEADRLALMSVIDALDSLNDFPNWSAGRSGRETAEDALGIGFDLSIAMERGDAPDAAVAERVDTLTARREVWQMRKRAIQEREWEELRKELKMEEAQFDVNVDLAMEAQEEYEREMAESAQWESDAAHEEREAARGAEAVMHTYAEDEVDLWRDEPDAARDR